MNPFTAILRPSRNHPRLNEAAGVAFLACALLLLLALASYHAGDASLNTVSAAPRVANWIGPFGAYLSDALFQLLGFVAFSLPVMLAGLGLAWMRSQPAATPWAKWAGVALWLLAAPALFALLPWHWHWRGAVPVEGLSGRLVGDLLVRCLNPIGATVVAVGLVLIAVYISTAFSLVRARYWLSIKLAFLMAWRDRWQNWRITRKQARQDRAMLRAEARNAKVLAREERRIAKMGREPYAAEAPEPSAAGENLPAEPLPAEPHASVWNSMPRAHVPVQRRRPEPVPAPPAVEVPLPAPPPAEPYGASASEFFAQPYEAAEAQQEDAEPAWEEPETPYLAAAPPAPVARAIHPEPLMIGMRADSKKKTVTVAPKSLSGYRLPPSTLLHKSDGTTIVREEMLREQARNLVEKCAEFNVNGQVTQINPGPVVTTFEFKPEAGVKYSRVTSLSEDLCLGMRAESILIERMAGKSTVGIQVPNAERETIWLRDVIESENFANSKSRLTIAMGKDINGRIVTTDLASMPHVLIAGSTGSGKSVAINAMIMSLLYKATPAQVRLILVDPKRVELGMYEGVPHLFTPIITEPKLAANALRNAVREMERRLKLLASRKARNIDQYNKLFEEATPSLFDSDVPEEPLPYIVIIIDELADLMMLDKANVEESVTRLAQMARAVGIHLVLATQRPSVDVITGLIKANVPTRISFRLSTKVDSRTILDSNGAESLLGRGDMLFLPPGTARLERVHAPFVTEKEINAVVDFWREQGQAEYVQGFLEAPAGDRSRTEDGGESENGDDNDEMFEPAVKLVLEFGKASTSLLQRRLRIGYGRAAHLIDLMERDGIVGPADGPKPREVLKPPSWLRETEEALR